MLKKDRQAPLGTKLPTSTMDMLDMVSQATGRPKNDLINIALLEYLPRQVVQESEGPLFSADEKQKPIADIIQKKLAEAQEIAKNIRHNATN